MKADAAAVGTSQTGTLKLQPSNYWHKQRTEYVSHYDCHSTSGMEKYVTTNACEHNR